MKNDKPLDQLTKPELIERVKTARGWYHKLTKSVETLTDENATLIREKETLTESIADRDENLAALTNQLEQLNAAITAAYDLIPLAPGKDTE